MKLWGLILGLMLFSANATAALHVKWQQDRVINIPLAVDRESTVTFPEVTLMWEEPGNTELFKRSFIDRKLFITPSKVFEKRVTFRGADSNRIYIVNFMAVDDPSSISLSEEVMIHIGGDKKAPSTESDGLGHVPTMITKVSYVDLIQFAAQSTYSDIIEPTPGIREVSVLRSPVIGLYQSGVFEATPLKSWVGGNVYVTAVKMANTTSSEAKFEPCRVKGDFISAAPQHDTVGAKTNDRLNATVVYFLSEKPFAQASNKRISKCRTM